MEELKQKRYTLPAIIFGACSALCLLAFLVLLALSHGNIFAIKPTWLGFLLLALFGFFLMISCVFIYLNLHLRYQEETTVICLNCGGRCSVENSFCPKCGEKLEKRE